MLTGTAQTGCRKMLSATKFGGPLLPRVAVQSAQPSIALGYHHLKGRFSYTRSSRSPCPMLESDLSD